MSTSARDVSHEVCAPSSAATRSQRPTRLFRQRLSAAVVLFAAVAGIAIAPACTTKPPNVAKIVSSGDASLGQPAVDASGAQVGMSDAPSTAGDPTDDRPKMNAAAKAAYTRGMTLWQASDIAGAKAAFLEAAQADKQAYQAYYSLGVMQELLGESAALESYRSAFTIVPSYEPAIVAYGLNLARKPTPQLSEADDFLSEKKDRMKSAAVLAALAEVKSLKHDTGNAQQYAQEALKLNPKYEPAMVTLARDHYRNRRLDLALYALKAIVDGENENNPARNKNNAEAHLLRAIIYKDQGHRALAMDEFKKSVELRPDFVDARIQLATYLLESGNAEEALPHLDAALKYQSENTKARLNRADAYRLLGKVTESKSEFEWVTKKDVNLYQAYYGLGLLYLFSSNVPGLDEKGKLSAAISSLEKYQQLRGTKAATGSSDDSDQLILRAKTKQDALNASDRDAAAASAAAASAAANPPPAASGNASATPASSGAPVPAASASAKP